MDPCNGEGGSRPRDGLPLGCRPTSGPPNAGDATAPRADDLPQQPERVAFDLRTPVLTYSVIAIVCGLPLAVAIVCRDMLTFPMPGAVWTLLTRMVTWPSYWAFVDLPLCTLVCAADRVRWSLSNEPTRAEFVDGDRARCVLSFRRFEIERDCAMDRQRRMDFGEWP